jgi:hypothetical protein
MSRFTMSLAAAVAAAFVATGVAALNAIGDERPAGRATAADLAKFADCLRAQGVDVPSDVGTRLPQWMRSHESEIGDAVRACKVDVAGKPAVVPEKLLECLRARGLNPPTAPDELKLWIARTPEARACVEAPKEAPDCGEPEEPRATARS